MMDRWEYSVRLRPRFAMQGNQQHSAASKVDQIMAKYRPIVPRPPLQMTSSLGKPTPDSTFFALDFLSTLNTTHNSNCDHNGSGYKRRASDCLGIPNHSPRVLKKPRGVPSLGIPSINQDILFSRVQVDGQTPTPAKGLEAMERREANCFNGSSVLDERCDGSDEWVSVKMVMESIGEVGVGNLRSKVDDVSVAGVAETRCGCESSDFLVSPVAAVEEKNDLVTLPLLPQTPPLHNGSSASSNKEGSVASNNNNGSSHKEGIPLRLFGRDLGHTEVESCQSNSNEALNLNRCLKSKNLNTQLKLKSFNILFKSSYIALQAVMVDPSLVFPNPRLRSAYIALQAWKSAISSDPSNVTGNWVGSNVCSYNGVFCAPALDNSNIEVVAGIDLNHADIAGYLPRKLGLLTDLALFHINTNRFCGTLHHSFKNLRLLFELDISSGPFPAVVLSLPSLKFLDIRFNGFEGQLPSEVFDKEMDAIFVNNMMFGAEIPSNIGNSPASVVVLTNNPMKGCLSSTIGNMGSTLNEIIVLNNNLTAYLPSEVGQLTSLTVFYVSFNNH